MASRGMTRTVEDLLKPNTNVDVSFRTSVLVMSDGRMKSGIVQKRDDGTLQLVDVNGKSETIREADVDEIICQRLSLMPANFSTLLKPRQLADLITWLMADPALQAVREGACQCCLGARICCVSVVTSCPSCVACASVSTC
jgi:putative heme-binding domain-containing protein